MKNTFQGFLIYIFFILCFKLINSLNGINYIDPGFSRAEYNYAKSIIQPYNSKNLTQCSLEKQAECFYKTLGDSGCLTDVFNAFDSIGNDYLNSGDNSPLVIIPAYDKCSIEKFLPTQNERKYLWILAGLKEVRERAPELKSLYPRCIKAMKKCDQCQLSIPLNVLEEIFKNCSQEAFKKAGVKTKLIKTLQTKINEELEKLSIQKIGSISTTSKAIQNLTFNDIENMKFVAANNPELEKFLCSHDTKSSLSLDSPDPSHKWFTLNEYEGMKIFLNENSYFRWSFCSGVFAISSSSNFVCFPSKYRNCGDVLRYLPPNDSYESLRHCRKIARSADFHHSAICN